MASEGIHRTSDPLRTAGGVAVLDRPGAPDSGLAADDRDRDRVPRKRRWIWVVVTLVVLAVVVGVWRHFSGASTEGAKAGDKGAAGARQIPIVAATARKGDLPIYLTGLGTVTGLNTVTVRTRVDGQLDKINFIEGQTIKAGEMLAEIDPRPFEVQLQQAQGQLARDQASLENARKDLARYREAGEAVARQQIDTAMAAVAQYEGALKTDQGQVASANLSLTYSKVTAPITGRVGLRLVDVGNVIHTNDVNGLVVITQLQPITVVFTLPQDEIPRLMKRMHESTPLPVDALDRDLTSTLATGSVLAVDNQVDPTSGTIRIKAKFENENLTLYPNQFVNARLLIDTRKDAVLVPSVAVQRGPDSTFVYVVKADQTVDVRPVQVGPTEADQTVIESGLETGEIVATDGVDKLTRGTKVAVRTAKGGGGGAASRPAGTTRPAGTEGGTSRGGGHRTEHPAGSPSAARGRGSGPAEGGR